MKTPDKIYIHPNYEPSGGWITTERREYQPDDVWETEYIRKDALLEWANERLNENDGRYSTFFDYALNLLIDKLNSL